MNFTHRHLAGYWAAESLEKLGVSAVPAPPATPRVEAERLKTPPPRAAKIPRGPSPLKGMKRGKAVRAVPQAARIKAPLDEMFPHQVKALARHAKGKHGIIFSHGTGTGKTRTSALAAARVRSETGGKTLVVAPAGTRANYEKGHHKWMPDAKTQIVATGKTPIRGDDVAIISYEAWKTRGPEFAAKGYDHVVFDEAHKGKDPERGVFKSMKEFRHLFKRYTPMTASLTSTSPEDVYQLVDAMTGGDHDLGSSSEFRKRYLMTAGEEAGFLKRRRMTKREAGKIVGFKNEEELGAKLKKFIHVADEEDLPKGTFPTAVPETVEVEMSPDQLALYKHVLRTTGPGVRERLESDALTDADLVKLQKGYNSLSKARAVSGGVHTMTTDLNFEDAIKHTPKARRLLEDAEAHIGEVGDAKIIIVTNLIKGGVDIIEAGLKARGISYGVFRGKGKGGTSEKERQAALTAFQDGDQKVLLVSPAGFEGLDGPNATMVQSYDPHFNPERVRQAEARGRRAGGLKHRAPKDRRVLVKRYVTKMPEKSGLAASLKRLVGMEDGDQHVEQKIYARAQQRHQLNQRLKGIIRGRPRREYTL